VAEIVEYHVVTLLGQQDASLWQFHPKAAADQQNHRRALLVLYPSRTLVTRGMNAPFDLKVVSVPGIIDGREMPQ